MINSIGFSHHVGGFLASDNENTVKDFGLTPLLLGRGHSLIDLDGPVWVSHVLPVFNRTLALI